MLSVAKYYREDFRAYKRLKQSKLKPKIPPPIFRERDSLHISDKSSDYQPKIQIFGPKNAKYLYILYGVDPWVVGRFVGECSKLDSLGVCPT